MFQNGTFKGLVMGKSCKFKWFPYWVLAGYFEWCNTVLGLVLHLVDYWKSGVVGAFRFPSADLIFYCRLYLATSLNFRSSFLYGVGASFKNSTSKLYDKHTNQKWETSGLGTKYSPPRLCICPSGLSPGSTTTGRTSHSPWVFIAWQECVLEF